MESIRSGGGGGGDDIRGNGNGNDTDANNKDFPEFKIESAIQQLEKITKEWQKVFAHTPMELKLKYEENLCNEVHKFRNLPFFTRYDSECNMSWGSGELDSNIVFILPFPKWPGEDCAFSDRYARSIVTVCENDGKYKESEIYMMNYLPWEPTNFEGSLDQVEFIEFFFPFLIRRLEIIKPTTVVMVGSGIQKIIKRALSSKSLRYLKQIRVVKTDNFNVFTVKKDALSVNFANAPHLFLRREEGEKKESYEIREAQHLKNFEGFVCEAFKMTQKSKSTNISVFQTMKEGLANYEKKEQTKKEKKSGEKEKKKSDIISPKSLPKGQLTLKMLKSEDIK